MTMTAWGARARAGLNRGDFRRNLGLKIGSVVVACLVWYTTNVLDRDAERILDVPVVRRQVPSNLVVVDPPSTPVAITLRGPRTLLEGVEDDRLHLVLPLRGLVPGMNRLDLQSGHLEPELPRRLRVVRLQPGRIELRAEVLRRRTLPVRAELAGRPAFGYSVAETTMAPETVEVSGPAGVVDQIRAVETVPVELRGLEADATRTVGLEFLGDGVQVEPAQIRVTVRVQEEIVSREFKKVPVRVEGAPGATVEPSALVLTLRGPQRLLDGFVLSADAATVDASNRAPGRHQVEVRVEVPDDLEVVTRRPEVVTLVVPERARP